MSSPTSGSAASGPELPGELSQTQRLALVRLEQRQCWLRGERLSIETILGRHPPLSDIPEAVVDLVCNELLLRQELGETPTATEYLERFPEHADELNQQLEMLQELQSSLLRPPDTVKAPTKPNLNGNGSLSSDSSPEATRLTVSSRSDRYRDDSGSAPLIPPPQPQVPPARVSGYEIMGELGRGGMGVVYKARQVQLKRLVALKMILAGAHASPTDLARFRAEAEAVARLKHPNIVPIYEIGEWEGRPYFSLEYVEGGSLDKKLAGMPQPAHEAAAFAETLARAVHAAHLQHIVHRDLKPANILLQKVESGESSVESQKTPDDTPLSALCPKITDFGLAKQLESEEGQTRTGALMGTPCYMAPEQTTGKTSEIGPGTDVYALGSILYEMLTGRPPFKAASVWETLEQVRAQEPVPPSRLQPNLPRDLETICLKCLNKPSGARYVTALALAEDLRRFLAGEPIQARPISLAGRAVKYARRRPALVGMVVALAAVVLLAPIAALLAVLYRNQMLEREVSEQRVQAEVRELLKQARASRDGGEWEKARDRLKLAVVKINDDRDLEELRPEAESLLATVKARLDALELYRTFSRRHEEALFAAMLAGSEGNRTARQTIRAKAQGALDLLGLSLEAPPQPVFALSFTEAEKTQLIAWSFELYLVVAEAQAQPPPGSSPAEKRQQAQQALALLERAERLRPATRALHLRRANYLEQAGELEASKKERDLAAAHQPADALDYYLVGAELYRVGYTALAIEALKHALELQPGHFWAQYFLAVCYVRLEKSDLARVHLNICLRERPDLVWLYLMRGFANGQLRDYLAAERDFQKALELQPTRDAEYALYNNRAVTRIGQEKLAEAIADLKTAIALKPNQYHAYVSLAKVYQQQKQLGPAIAQFDRAVEVAGALVRARDLEPATLALLYRNRARLQLERQDRAAALRDFDRALELEPAGSPGLARTHAERGRVLHSLQRFSDALAAYNEALKIQRENTDFQRWRAEALLRLGRYTEALTAYDLYLQKGGRPTAEIYRSRGLARDHLRDDAGAIDDYTQALELGSEDAALHVQRGRVYLRCQAYQLAERDFDRAVADDRKNADAWLGRGLLRAKQGRVSEAADDAEHALQLPGLTAPRLLQAAHIYAQAYADLKRRAAFLSVAQQRSRDRYLERALELVERVVELTAADERIAYWQETILKDSALGPVRSAPEFARLNRKYNQPAPEPKK